MTTRSSAHIVEKLFALMLFAAVLVGCSSNARNSPKRYEDKVIPLYGRIIVGRDYVGCAAPNDTYHADCPKHDYIIRVDSTKTHWFGLVTPPEAMCLAPTNGTAAYPLPGNGGAWFDDEHQVVFCQQGDPPKSVLANDPGLDPSGSVKEGYLTVVKYVKLDEFCQATKACPGNQAALNPGAAIVLLQLSKSRIVGFCRPSEIGIITSPDYVGTNCGLTVKLAHNRAFHYGDMRHVLPEESAISICVDLASKLDCPGQGMPVFINFHIPNDAVEEEKLKTLLGEYTDVATQLKSIADVLQRPYVPLPEVPIPEQLWKDRRVAPTDQERKATASVLTLSNGQLPELLVEDADQDACGSGGGCPWSIYGLRRERSKDGSVSITYKTLLQSQGGVYVLDTVTNGYRDLLIDGGAGGSVLKFNDTSYVETQCFSHEYKTHDDVQLTNCQPH